MKLKAAIFSALILGASLTTAQADTTVPCRKEIQDQFTELADTLVKDKMVLAFAVVDGIKSMAEADAGKVVHMKTHTYCESINLYTLKIANELDIQLKNQFSLSKL